MTSPVKPSAKNRNVWTPDAEYMLGYYRTLARVLGIWPLDKWNAGARIRFSFVFITQLIMPLDIVKNLVTVGACGSATDFVDILSLGVGGFICAMKITILRINQQNMMFIINSIIDDWSIVVAEESRRIMKHCALIGRSLFILQLSCAYVAACPVVILKIPIVNALLNDGNISQRLTPIGSPCWTSNTTLCTTYNGCDTYFFGLVMHVCGQFEVLCRKIEDLSRTIDSVEQKRILRYLIQRHNQLLRLADNFEETYNIILAVQVVGDIVIASVTAIVILINLKTSNSFILMGLIVRLYLVYVQLFLFCFIGETLSEKTEKLQISMYNCCWYRMPPDIIRDIRFVIMRSNYRFKLTAGKMCTMDFENFKMIFKTMGSYFTVLRLMFVENK